MVSSKITGRAFMIDTVGMGNSSTVAVYVVKGGRRTAVIDCGYASTYGNVMQGLRELGIEPSRVDYLIPTHLHLDHAGAAGHLLRYMPRARVIAHERAVPHLVDPTKLVESATSLFGEKLVQMYGKPLPIDKNKITAVGAESHVDLGGATLTTLHAPGHAPHQISVLFEEEHLLFSADAVGMVFPCVPHAAADDPSPELRPGEAGADPRDAAADRPEDAPRPALRGQEGRQPGHRPDEGEDRGVGQGREEAQRHAPDSRTDRGGAQTEDR